LRIVVVRREGEEFGGVRNIEFGNRDGDRTEEGGVTHVARDGGYKGCNRRTGRFSFSASDAECVGPLASWPWEFCKFVVELEEVRYSVEGKGRGKIGEAAWGPVMIRHPVDVESGEEGDDAGLLGD
jgi:hypothetical protein